MLRSARSTLCPWFVRKPARVEMRRGGWAGSATGGKTKSVCMTRGPRPSHRSLRDTVQTERVVVGRPGCAEGHERTAAPAHFAILAVCTGPVEVFGLKATGKSEGAGTAPDRGKRLPANVSLDEPVGLQRKTS